MTITIPEVFTEWIAGVIRGIGILAGINRMW